MIIYFCRHGQTDHNIQGIIQGHLDTPLNAHGFREAQRLAQRLSQKPFKEAWSSPLSRARITAEIVVAEHPGLQLQLHPAIKERYLGRMEGRRRLRGEPVPEDAESGSDLHSRIFCWLDEFLRDRTNRPADDTILVVSHGAWLGALLNLLIKRYKFQVMEGVDLRAHCLNTSVMKVQCLYHAKKNTWIGRIDRWGDISHLTGLHEEDLEVADNIGA